jgi:hypothetical protein
VTYTPNANFNGTDTFVYRVTDFDGDSDMATVTVTVTPANDPPDARDDTATTPEDTAVTIPVLANDVDPDGDALTVTAVTQPANGMVVINADNTVTYTPAMNFNGTDTFTYTISDGMLTDTATVTVTVTPANDPPDARDDTATTPEDTAVTIPVLANDVDPDGDALTVTAVTQPANGMVVINADNTVTYTPAMNFNGTDTFTYTISDGQLTDTATVTVTVTPQNDAPDARDDAATTVVNTPVTIPVLANDVDPDGDPLTVTAVTTPANGAVVINADNTVTYTPNLGFTGTDTFTYTISDPGGLMDTATVTVTVMPDEMPDAMDDVATTLEDTAVTIPVLANDTGIGNVPLTVVIVTAPSNGAAVVNADNTVTYTPNMNFTGTDTFVYRVTDFDGDSDMATVTVTVTPVNDPPDARDDIATTPEDTMVIIPVLANDVDPDGDALTVTAVTQPANGMVVVNPDNTVTYTPAANFNGTDTFTYTISDGMLTDTAVVTVTVTPANDPPDARDDTARTVQGVPVTIPVLANDIDIDGDPLTVTAVTPGSNGTVVINADNTVTYTPNAGFFGTDTFTYTVSDGMLTDTASVTVVVEQDEQPDAVDDAATTMEDVAVTIPVLANDTGLGNAPVVVTLVSGPSNGVAVVNMDNTVTYTPNLNFNGTDMFVYRVTDFDGDSDTATVTVTVTPLNDPPDAMDDTATTPEDTAATIPVLANDVDVDGDALTVTAVTQPANGAVVINPDNTVMYTPNLNFFGTDTFTYTISDPSGATDTATVTVTVTPVNDMPDAMDDTASTVVDLPVRIAVLANDVDVDGDPLTVVSVTPPMNGTAVINADNTVTYTPNMGFIGTDTFTYTISDPGGLMDTATVTVIVMADEMPDAMDDTATTMEDTFVIIPVLANDTGIGNVPLTVTIVSGPSNGTATVNMDNTVTYTPAANFNGMDTFVYRVTDVDGDTDTAMVVVTVTPVPDPPDAMDDTATTPEDTLVIIPVLANDVDPDGDPLTVTAVTQPANGMVVITADNTVTYTPNANFFGTDTFTYTISDGMLTDTAVVTVTVTPAPDPPDARDDMATAECNRAVVIPVLANDVDPDGDPLTVVAVTQGTNGAVVINPDQTVTYTPNTGFTGTDMFTYTISDPTGLMDTATVTVTVADTTPPTVICPTPDPVPANEMCQATVPDLRTLVVATDNCTPADQLTITQNPAPGTVVGAGVTVITLTITDAAGNATTCTINFTVVDVTPPVIMCPAPITAECMSPAGAVVNFMTTATDTCDPNPVVTCTPPSGSTFPIGTTTVTCTARDMSNNTSMCSFTVTVVDTMPPRVTCPTLDPVPANEMCQAAVPDIRGLVIATDDCTPAGGLLITQNPAPGTVVGVGTTVITVTVTDAAGNSATCTTNFVVVDATPPVVTCPTLDPVPANEMCQAAVPDIRGLVIAMDNCTPVGELTITQNPAPGTLVGVGTTVITVTVTDAANNSATCTTNFVVVDVTPPVVTCPTLDPVPADANCMAAVPDIRGLVIAMDNCTPAGELTIMQNPAPGTMVGLGTTVITVTVTDAAGNSATCTTNFVVVDATPPVVTCPMLDPVPADANCMAAVPDIRGLVIAMDNCTPAGGLTITQNPAPGTVVGLGTTVITVTVTDAANNSATCTTNFVVVDATPPVVTCPTLDPVPADANCMAAVPDIRGLVMAMDNCTPVGGLTITQNPAPGTMVGLGTTVITVTVTDAANNSATCTTNFVVVDATPPVVTCPANITAECSSPAGAVVNFMTTATDNCDPNPVVTCTPPSGSTFPIGTTTVTCTARDMSNNTSMCSFTVTVVDTTPPVITCPANITAECMGMGGAVVEFVATATDTCDSTPTVVCTPPSGSTFPLGTTTVTCVATDDNGNSAMCSFTVTVVDTIAPVVMITSPTEGQRFCPSTTTMITVTGTVMDVCGVTAVRVRAERDGRVISMADCMVTGTMFSCTLTGLTPGPIKITVEAMDRGNNVGMAMVNVRINQRPMANAGPDQVVNEGARVTLDGRGSSDPDGDPLRFRWRQTGGPAVTLMGADTAQPTFIAPLLRFTDPPCVDLTFELIVNDGCEDSAPDTVTIRVQNQLILLDDRNQNQLTVFFIQNCAEQQTARYTFFVPRSNECFSGTARILRGQGDGNQIHIIDGDPGNPQLFAIVDAARLTATAVFVRGVREFSIFDDDLNNTLVPPRECAGSGSAVDPRSNPGQKQR